jgi:hypothetical protein
MASMWEEGSLDRRQLKGNRWHRHRLERTLNRTRNYKKGRALPSLHPCKAPVPLFSIPMQCATLENEIAGKAVDI